MRMSRLTKKEQLTLLRALSIAQGVMVQQGRNALETKNYKVLEFSNAEAEKYAYLITVLEN